MEDSSRFFSGIKNSGSPLNSTEASLMETDSIIPVVSKDDHLSTLCDALERGMVNNKTRRSTFPQHWKFFRPTPPEVSLQQRRDEAIAYYQSKRELTMQKSRKLTLAFAASNLASVAVMDELNSSNMEIGGAATSNQGGNEEIDLGQYLLDGLYSNLLMQPEYLWDIPERFDTEWMCIPVPQGLRCMLIAREGSTEARDNDGNVLDVFQSDLPGGSSYYRHTKQSFTILDCIQVSLSSDYMTHDGAVKNAAESYSKQSYFVVDMIAWNGTFFYNCSAECRLFLKSSYLQQHEGLSKEKIIKHVYSNSEHSKAHRSKLNRVQYSSNEENVSMESPSSDESAEWSRLIVDLPILPASTEGLMIAKSSQFFIPFESNRFQPQTQPIEESAKLLDRQYFGFEKNFDFEFSNSEPGSTVTPIERNGKSLITMQVQGYFFYYKDMDYVVDTTPMFCVLPREAFLKTFQPALGVQMTS